jgi:tetratricopeptide (TPR) repeat protein
MAMHNAGGSQCRSCRLVASWAVLASLLLVPALLGPAPAAAQDGGYPPPQYYLAFQPFEEGDFRDAAQAFRSAARGGLRSGEVRWIDSICYHTMIGECLYHMGEPAAALEQYTSALNLFQVHKSWLLSIRFPPALTAQTNLGTPVTWGPKTRPTAIGSFPERAMSAQGQIDLSRTVREGGVVRQAQFLSINANEVARCIAVSLRRRAELLGPVAAHDPLTAQLVGILAARPAPPNHWSQAWVECWLGLSYLAANRPVEAAASLQASLVTNGQFDHPLTAIGLIELGKLAFEQGQYDKAATCFYEASFPAAAFSQHDLIEEALRWGAQTHVVAQRPGLYPPLAPAAAMADRKSLRHLQVSMLLESAENVARGDAKAAAALLEQARRGMLRQEMQAGAHGGRYEYLNALVNYQAGNGAAADAAFARAITYYQRASPWLFQINMAEKLLGTFTERTADELYSILLREPTSTDWSVRPAETLALILAPGIVPWEHWFEINVQRNDSAKAIEIAERVRRKQFYASLPMGGRLLAFRWVLQAPDEALTEAGLLQRQDLFVKYPALAELSRRATALSAELRSRPLIAADPAEQEKQQAALAELAKISQAQEALLRPLAVSRDPCDFVFPPLRSVKEIREKLKPRQGILLYFATSRDVYGFLIIKDQSPIGWRIPSASRIRGAIAGMLKEWGNLDANYSVQQKDIVSEEWKATSRELYFLLTNRRSATTEPAYAEIDELVIVPYGVLWYLPFESLLAGSDEAPQPWLSTMRIRYAPLASVAIPDKRGVPPTAETILFAGKLHPQEADDAPARFMTDLQAVMPGIRSVSSSSVPSALLSSVCQRLVVFCDIDWTRTGPFAWAPFPVDTGKQDPSLAAWLNLPWGAPLQMVLPGIHTAADSAMKKGGTGDEIFLSVCGLMAAGSRTIVVSRWRVGGESTRRLMREYLQELPRQEPVKAWQRSVQLLRSVELDLDREPRLNRSTFNEVIRGEHPFFWAGYLLVDPGVAE